MWGIHRDNWDRKPVNHARIAAVIHQAGRRVDGGCYSFLALAAVVNWTQFGDCVSVAHHLAHVNQYRRSNQIPVFHVQMVAKKGSVLF